jgi:hypothetical protein
MAVTSVWPSGFAARFRLVLQGQAARRRQLRKHAQHRVDNWLQATQRIADGSKLAQLRRETAGAPLLRRKIDFKLSTDSRQRSQAARPQQQSVDWSQRSWC